MLYILVNWGKGKGVLQLKFEREIYLIVFQFKNMVKIDYKIKFNIKQFFLLSK